MRQTLFLLFLISAFSFGQSIPSGFQLIAYEGFDYSNGTNISNQGGGSGWSSNWAANYYGNSSMYVYSSGYSYSGLTTNGNRLEWGGSGQYQPHAVKRSVTSPNSGIVYFQFISDFRSTSGGGTDNIRFYKGGALQGGVGGNGSPHTINILDSGLSNGISSGSAIGDQSLVVMRINYDSNTTELWVNPNLSSFDYVNPGSADAQAAYDIEFDQIELVFRSGASIDEISVFKLIPLELSSTAPISNQNTVTLDTDIAVTFDSPVKTSTVNASNIVITGKNTGIISGTFSGGGTTTVSFNPTNDFKPGEVITVTLTSGLQNTSGGALTVPQTFSFTTRNAATVSPTFTATDIATSADGADSVFAADMDGDGDMDILSASNLDNTIAWYENDGNANPSFTAANITTSALGPQSVYAADMDGDGDMDVLSASYYDNTIAWYENDGNANPSFTAATIATSAGGARSVYAADMDGDGDLDIVSASTLDDTIAWYENDGNADPSFTATDIATSADGAITAIATDIDGDGDMDILSASYYDDTIAWYENDGNTNPSFTAADIATSADGAWTVYAADMDGDGDMDILSASNLDDTIAWYENDGNANPSFTAANITTSANGARSVYAADIDGDGDMDVLSASGNDDTIAWYENDGNADPTWTKKNIATSANGAFSVFAADMDGDGDMDILSASYDGDTIAWYETAPALTFNSSTPATSSNTVALDADITLTFNLTVKASTVNASNIVITGENTGIISGTFSGGGSTTVGFNPTNDFKPGEVITVTLTSGLQNTSGGALTVPQTFSFTTRNAATVSPTFTAADIATSADGAVSVFAADMDGDGDMDVLSASYSDNTIAWYENDGNANPSFTAATIATSAGGARSVYAADMDGDGDLDILSASQNDDTIAWYENDGNADPTFAAADIATSADGARSVYAADVDGDGDMDILSASMHDDTVAWYENDGNAEPSFTAADIATSADGAYSVYAADMDGDGDMDVLSASRFDDTIAWYENDGNANPSFTAADIATSADGAHSVYAADIDGDGDLDIISASYVDNTIAWYENDGNANPSFTAADIATSANSARSVYVADMDGDGDMDVLSASYNDDTIAWYENDGNANPSFTAADIATSADGAHSVYVADMDGDGDMDILSASHLDNTIAWYEVQSSNTAPTDIILSSSAVNENVSIGTLVAALSTTDTDGSDTHTYSLVSGAGDTDNARFSINGVNLLTAAAVDYESQNSFSILLQTSDGTATYTESFTISVIDGEDDSDGDGIFDNSDAFPSDASEWSDNDGDGTGDNADTDDDNDGWSDTVETSCNTNPLSSSETPSDFDQDGNPDCLDPDDDNDTYPDLEDTFPFNAEEWADNDEDGTGDNADTDDDNDGYLDADEIQCESDPLDSSSLPLDFDVDGAPDCIDDNDDNDYCLDVEDDFPLNRDLCVDTDGDGIDNRYEFDSDNDGVADTRDAFPLDPNESQDTDGDGIGDNEDQDDNNDGFSDEAPIISKVITPNQPGVESTWKIINIEDYPFTTVRVYAPDGSIVFESTNYQNQWRGNNMRTGSPLPTGPYYFRISYGSVLEKVEDGWLYIFN